jgi:hypothetical protein
MRRSTMPGQRLTFHSGPESRHGLRVRASYDRMFGRWLHSDLDEHENSSDDRKAA